MKEIYGGIGDVPSRSLLAFGTLREKPNSRKNIREMKCVISDKFAKNKIYDKRRLEVDSQAEKFLKMAKNRFDDVYNCTEGTHTVWYRFILP